jgi:PKD repeat protein
MSSWPNRPPTAPRGEAASRAREPLGAPRAGGPLRAAAPTAAAEATDARRRARGQSMVEFALVLPILFVLLLISIDFGRVYLGYINVQNMARIAANEAATNPEGWLNADPTVIASYRQQILEDARAINCDIPMSNGTLDASANPDFTGSNVGDTATVRITCDFGVITPVISNIVGGTVQVGGEATFPVRTGMIANGGATGGGIEKPAADFYADPDTVTIGTPIKFHYSGGGGAPTTFLWQFNDYVTNALVDSSTDQDPLIDFPTSGAYNVTLKVGNAAGYDTITKTNAAIVLPSSSIAFTATPLNGVRPLPVTFKDESANAKKWSWTFGDGTTSTQQNPSKTYATSGTYTVTLTIEDEVGETATLVKTNYVSVSDGLCKVPNFTGAWSYDAQALWGSAGFLTQVKFGSQDLPWTIKSQSVVGNSDVPCASEITVRKN